MNTDALIDALARTVTPVPARSASRRLMLSLIGGTLITLALILSALPIRPDIASAIHSFAFWMKLSYTAAVGVLATRAMARLARPEPVRLIAFWPVLLPLGALAVIAIVQMSQTPTADWGAMWLGHTYRQCSARILLLSLPILAAFFWWLRQLAPTRPRAGGAVAGLAAGGWGATLYGLHCPEVTALFVVTWYSLGMALGGIAGALLGHRSLRW
ncbi:MAG: DUF1109 domain-containing protein [Croceibacterium sp.]